MSTSPLSSQKILTNEAPLVFSPLLAGMLGQNAAQFLQQIHYWVQRSNHIIDGVAWVFNTYAQWAEQFPFMSPRTIRRTIRKLEDLNLIRSERLEAKNWYQRKWYTVCYEELEVLMSSIGSDCPDQGGHTGPIHVATLATSYTEISSIDLKETTNIKTKDKPVLKRKDQREDICRDVIPLSENLTEDSSGPQINTQEHLTNSTNSANNSLKLSEENILDPQLKDEIEEAISPVLLNPQIRKLILATNLEVIQDSIAVVKQRKKVGKVKNPAGLFVKAVQEGWKPSVGNKVIEAENRVPEDFNEWFELARQLGVVMASTMLNGVLCVCTAGGNWEPYEELRCAFSLPWLKKALTGKRAIFPQMT